MTTIKHDMIVLGAGPGGYEAAIRAAQLGLNVGCIEKEERLGGTCLRVGCIPSKALLESSELYYEAQHGMAAHGVKVGKVQLDLPTMLTRKDEVVDGLTGGVAQLFAKNKIARYRGVGRLDGPGKVVVDGAAEPIAIEAKYILLATGSKVASLRGIELDHDYIGDSTDALSYSSVPGRLIVIGAGYIGLEMGSVWNRLGSQVTVLEYMDRILPGMDAEIAREAQRILKKQGLEFRLSSRVTGARVEGQEALVEIEGSEPLRADKVLVVVGRVPCTDGLGLESVGIQTDERGRIPVNAHFETGVAGIYAFGDVIAGPMLAHKASEEGIACVEQIVTGWGHVNYNAIPGIVYTHPEIATVGSTEEELQAAGTEYRKGVFHFKGNGRARALNQTDGRVKILADAKTDRVLGVHIIGPRAGDLIAECVTAMEFGASSEDIARTCHAHPTLSEVVKEAALAVDNRAIHV